MNANRYRLIFDKRTGMLVPVAEFTTGAKKGNSPGMGDGMGETSTPKWNQLCAAVALAAGGLGSGTLNAQIVPDGTTQTTVTRTAADKPLINIANPNASGLSHNKFTQFNADGTGPIFNNSMVDSATSSGGFALKNPHLSRNATSILTEVTGTDISRLQGQMEIHGGAPVDLIIANPNGLYVNGISLLGGNSLTLTTGKPDAQGRKFEVHGGHVDLRGDISTTGMKYFDVVARSVALSGKVSGGVAKMRFATGLNTLQTLADKYGDVTKRANGGGTGAPVHAIQGSEVGSMHGSHVTLLSTESGVGVRHEGQLISTTDINITADGDLRIRGLDARNSAFLKGDDVSLGGVGATEQAVSTKVNYHLDVDARGDLSLEGKHDISKGVFKVGGTLTSEKDASVTAIARGYNLQGRVDVKASAFDLLGGTWSASHFLNVDVGDMGVAANAQLTTSHGTVKVANKLRNAGKFTVNEGGTYDIDVLGELVNADKSQILAEHLWLDAKQLDNAGSITGNITTNVTLGAGDSSNTGTLSSTFANVNLIGEETHLFNSGDIIAADGAMTIRLASLQNLQKIEGETKVDMVIAQGMENQGAVLSDDKLDITAAWLRNSGDKTSISAGTNATLKIAGDVENLDHANILGTDLVSITAGGKVMNADEAAIGGGKDAEGTMPAIEGDLSITAAGGISNIGKGELYGTIVNLTTDGVVLNRDGAEIRGDWTTLTAGGALRNDGGTLRGDKQLDALVGGDITNEGGTLQGGSVLLEGNRGLDNTAGSILGSRVAIAVQDDILNVEKGKIVSDDYVHLTGASIDNRDSLVQGGGNVVVTAKGGLKNTQDGTLAAGKTLDVKTGKDILNDASHMRGQHVILETPGNLTNKNAGTIKADEQLQAKVAGALKNTGAGTQMTGETVFLDVEKDVVNTDGAVVQASEYLQLKAAQLANTRSAKILSGVTDGATPGHMEITVGGKVVNRDGAHIVATGGAMIDAREDVLNEQNAKIAGGKVWIANKPLETPVFTQPTNVLNDATSTIEGVDLVSITERTNLINQGRIGANDVNINTAERVDNPGRIVAGNGIWIDTRAIDNTATGTIEAKYLVDMKTIGFKNIGKIFSDEYVNLLIKDGHDLTIDETAHGPIALERLEIWANDVTINRTLANPGSIKINAEEGFLLNNEGIVSGKSFTGLIGKDFDNLSLVWAAKNVDVKAQNLWNRGQEIEAGENMWIELEGTLLNTDTARIASGGHMALDALEIQNKATYDGGIRTSQEGTSRTSATQYASWAMGGTTFHYETDFGAEWVKTREAGCGVVSGYYGCWGEIFVYAATDAGLVTVSSNLRRVTSGEIAAGGSMRINDGSAKDRGANIRNDGDIRAGGSLVIDGHVHNVGRTAQMSLISYLKSPMKIASRAYVVSGSLGEQTQHNKHRETFDSLYDFFHRNFASPSDGPWASFNGDDSAPRWGAIHSLKTSNHPVIIQVMSHVFGADWRNVSFNTLRDRWWAWAMDPYAKQGFDAAPEQGPSIAAGGSIHQTGGGVHNGTGSKYLQNQTITVEIDGETVETVGGNFDVLRDLKDLTQAIDPSRALEQITRESNKKFRKAPTRTDLPVIEWAKLPKVGDKVVVELAPVPVSPIYETRFGFIDQNTFYGTDYFFKSIGYNPDRTVTVIGDNFFINELVTKQVGVRVAGFFAVQDKVTGTAMVQKLMDNAGAEGAKLGLQVGIAPNEEQLAGLESDIVWFVEKDVDGVKALVPQVFLSKKTVAALDEQRNAGVASIDAGEHITIDADESGISNNDGTIRAGKSMLIESKGKVTNTTRAGLKNGGLRAGEDLLIDAKGDVVNIGADIIAGRHGQVLTDGNFEDTVRTGYNDKGNLIVTNKGRLRGGGAEEGASRKVPSFEEKKDQSRTADAAGGISTMPAGGGNPGIQTGAIANPDAAVISVAGATNVGGAQTLAVGIAPQPSGQPALAIEAGVVVGGGNNKMIQTGAIANSGVTVGAGLVSQPSGQPTLAIGAGVMGGNNKMIQTGAIANVGVTASVGAGLVPQPSGQPIDSGLVAANVGLVPQMSGQPTLAIEAMVEAPQASGPQAFVDTTAAGGTSVPQAYSRPARGMDRSDFTDVQAPVVATETPTTPEPAPRESKGSFSIHAKGNIKLSASDIRAQDVSLKAGKDLIVRDVHEVASTFEQEKGRTEGLFSAEVSMERRTSEARSVGARIQGSNDDGTLIMHAEGDVRLQGGEYGADVGSIRGKNVITTTAKDYKSVTTQTRMFGLVAGGRMGVAGFGLGGQEGGDAWSGSAVDGKPSGDGRYGGEPGDDGFRGHQDGRANSSGKAVLGETAGGRFGVQDITFTTTHKQVKNKNAQLNFGSGVEIKGEDRVDIGGADIRAWKEVDGKIQKGDVYIEGGEVVATKYRDVDQYKQTVKDNYYGAQGSASSSVVDFVNNRVETGRNVAEGMGVDAGMEIGSIAGDATNVAMNDMASASGGFTFESKETTVTKDYGKQNVNNVVGNIVIKSTKGDINLAGVILDGRGAGVVLDSANKLRLGSAVDKSASSEKTKMENYTLSADVGGGLGGLSGPGASFGYNKSESQTSDSGTANANTLVMGDQVVLRSKGDTTLAGANVIGGRVSTDIGGKLEIFSQQDTYDSESSSEEWGVTGGLSLLPTAGGNHSKGSGYERRRTTGQQSGIVAGHLDLNVKGDVHMKGSHIITETGTSNVGGKLIAENIRDTIEKDGTTIGGGTNVGAKQVKRIAQGKGGAGSLPDAGNMQIEKDERHFYDAEQLVTISGIEINAKGGTEGEINTDADNMVRVNSDQRIASSRISMTIAPKQMKDMAKGALNKLRNKWGAGSPQVAPAFTNLATVTTALDGAPTGPKRPIIGEVHEFERGKPTPNLATNERPEIATRPTVEEPIYATVIPRSQRPKPEVTEPTRTERPQRETPVEPEKVVERKPSIDTTPVIVDAVDRSKPGYRFDVGKPVDDKTPVVKVGDRLFVAQVDENNVPKRDQNGNLVPTRRYVETTEQGKLVEAGLAGLDRDGNIPGFKQHGFATLEGHVPHRSKTLKEGTGTASADTRAPKSDPSKPTYSPESTMPRNSGGEGAAPRPVDPARVTFDANGNPVMKKPDNKPSQRKLVLGDDGRYYEARPGGQIIGQQDTRLLQRADSMTTKPFRTNQSYLPATATGPDSAAIDNKRRSSGSDDSSTETDGEEGGKSDKKNKRASKKKVGFEVPSTQVTADVVAQKLAAQGEKPLYKTVVGVGADGDGVEIVEAQPLAQKGGIEAGREQAALDRITPLTERVPTQYQRVDDVDSDDDGPGNGGGNGGGKRSSSESSTTDSQGAASQHDASDSSGRDSTMSLYFDTVPDTDSPPSSGRGSLRGDADSDADSLQWSDIEARARAEDEERLISSVKNVGYPTHFPNLTQQTAPRAYQQSETTARINKLWAEHDETSKALAAAEKNSGLFRNKKKNQDTIFELRTKKDALEREVSALMVESAGIQSPDVGDRYTNRLVVLDGNSPKEIKAANNLSNAHTQERSKDIVDAAHDAVYDRQGLRQTRDGGITTAKSTPGIGEIASGLLKGQSPKRTAELKDKRQRNRAFTSIAREALDAEAKGQGNLGSEASASGPAPRSGQADALIQQHGLYAEQYDLQRRERLDSTDSADSLASSLSDAEYMALGIYTNGKYEPINQALRNGTLAGEHARLADLVSTALRNAPVDRRVDAVTYRGLAIPSETLGRQIASGVFTDAGFMSTSKERRVAEGFARHARKGEVPVLLEVDGGGVDVSEVSIEGVDEAEILFDRGTRFDIVDSIPPSATRPHHVLKLRERTSGTEASNGPAATSSIDQSVADRYTNRLIVLEGNSPKEIKAANNLVNAHKNAVLVDATGKDMEFKGTPKVGGESKIELVGENKEGRVAGKSTSTLANQVEALGNHLGTKIPKVSVVSCESGDGCNGRAPASSRLHGKLQKRGIETEVVGYNDKVIVGPDGHKYLGTNDPDALGDTDETRPKQKTSPKLPQKQDREAIKAAVAKANALDLGPSPAAMPVAQAPDTVTQGAQGASRPPVAAKPKIGAKTPPAVSPKTKTPNETATSEAAGDAVQKPLVAKKPPVVAKKPASGDASPKATTPEASDQPANPYAKWNFERTPNAPQPGAETAAADRTNDSNDDYAEIDFSKTIFGKKLPAETEPFYENSVGGDPRDGLYATVDKAAKKPQVDYAAAHKQINDRIGRLADEGLKLEQALKVEQKKPFFKQNNVKLIKQQLLLNSSAMDVVTKQLTALAAEEAASRAATAPQNDKYHQRVIVATDYDKSLNAGEVLFENHPDNSVLVRQNGKQFHIVKGEPVGGETKVDYIGHFEDGKLAGMTSRQLVERVGDVQGLVKGKVTKLSVTGCGTDDCGPNGMSYVDNVRRDMVESGINARTKGYKGGPIKVNDAGKKVLTTDTDPLALGNEDGASGNAGKATGGADKPPAVLPKPKVQPHGADASAAARDQITKTVHERGLRADRYGNLRYGPAQAGPGEKLLGHLAGKSTEQVNQDKQARQQQRLIEKRVEVANALISSPQKRMTSDGSITVGDAHAKPAQRLAGLLRGKSKDQVDQEKTQRQRERYQAWEATNKSMHAHDVLGTSVATASAAELDLIPGMSKTPGAKLANKKGVLLLEDPTAAHTVAKLRNQYPGMAIVTVDADNQVHLVSGSIKPGQASSMLVLGHGRLRMVGTHNAAEVAAHITTLRDDYGIVVRDVDLAVCQADACDANGASLRSDLKSALAQSGLDVNVTGKLGDVIVFENGQKHELAPTSEAIANKRTALMGEWQDTSDALAAARAKGEDTNAHEVKLMEVEQEIGKLMRGMDARARKDLLMSKGFDGVVTTDGVARSGRNGTQLGNEDGATGNAGKATGGADKQMSWDEMRAKLKPTPAELEQEKRDIQREVESDVELAHGRMDRFGNVHHDGAKPNAFDLFVGRMQGKTPEQVKNEKDKRQKDRLISAKVKEHISANQKGRAADLVSIDIQETQERRDMAARTLASINRGPLANTPDGHKAKFKTEQMLRHFDSRLAELRMEKRVRVLDQGATLRKTRFKNSEAFDARSKALRALFENDAAPLMGKQGARNDTFEGDDGVDNHGQPNEPIYQNWSDAAMRRVGHEELPLDVRHAIANLPSLNERDFVDAQGNARLPMLLRGDDRAPGLVFGKGMQARLPGKASTAGSVLHHVHGNKKTGMVSTTKSGPIAASIADDGAGGYVYVVLGKDGVDVNKWMAAEGRPNLYDYEQEVLVPDGIDGSNIVGAYRVNRGGTYAKDSFIPNPNFRATPNASAQSNADNSRAPASAAAKASNDDNGDGDDNGGGDGNGRSRTSRTQERDPGASHPASSPEAANQGSEARNTSEQLIMGRRAKHGSPEGKGHEATKDAVSAARDDIQRVPVMQEHWGSAVRIRADIGAEILNLRMSKELVRASEVVFQAPSRLESALGRKPTPDEMRTDPVTRQAVADREAVMSKVRALEAELEALPEASAETPIARLPAPRRMLKNGLPADGQARPKRHQIVAGVLQGKSPGRIAEEKTERQRQRYEEWDRKRQSEVDSSLAMGGEAKPARTLRHGGFPSRAASEKAERLRQVYAPQSRQQRKVAPARQTPSDMPSPTTTVEKKFDQRVIFYEQSPAFLKMHPQRFRDRWGDDDVVIVHVNEDGSLITEAGTQPRQDAHVQLQFMGLADRENHTIGGRNAEELAGQAKAMELLGLDVQEVKVGGCESSLCAKDGTSMVGRVVDALHAQDMHPQVKGYPYKFYVDVDGTKRPASREDNPAGEESRVLGKHYDQHLIVMQQDMADVGVMGAYLQNAHLRNTALWQWGDGGVFRRIAGIELEPGAVTKLTLLGHGNPWFRTLGGRDGFELGAQVSVIQSDHGLVIPKVYAFGCYADCDINGSTLVRDLRTALHGYGIDAEVKGPPGPIIATPDGRKVQLDAPVPGSMGVDTPLSLSSMQRIGHKTQGHARGAIFRDASEQTWYVKGAGGDEDFARNEVLAGELLRMAGVHVPDVRTIDLDDAFGGGIGVASKAVEGARPVDWRNDDAARRAARKDFAAQAFVGNRDAIGMSGDNYVVGKDGVHVSVDHGGALRYQAKGEPKGSEFGKRVQEIDALRDPSKVSAVTTDVYRQLTFNEIRDGMERVVAIGDDAISETVELHGPRGAKDRAELVETLLARKGHYEAALKAMRTASPAIVASAPKPDPMSPPVPVSMAPGVAEDVRFQIANLHRLQQKDFLKPDGTSNGPLSFRGVAESPDDIFPGGFQPRARGAAAHASLRKHQLNEDSGMSNLVSVSRVPDIAAKFAVHRQAEAWVYVMHGLKSLDINQRLGRHTEFSDEHEGVVPDGIPRETIVGAYRVNEKGIVPGTFRPSPYFEATGDASRHGARRDLLVAKHHDALRARDVVAARGDEDILRRVDAHVQRVEGAIGELMRDMDADAVVDAYRREWKDTTLVEDPYARHVVIAEEADEDVMHAANKLRLNHFDKAIMVVPQGSTLRTRAGDNDERTGGDMKVEAAGHHRDDGTVGHRTPQELAQQVANAERQYGGKVKEVEIVSCNTDDCAKSQLRDVLAKLREDLGGKSALVDALESTLRDVAVTTTDDVAKALLAHGIDAKVVGHEGGVLVDREGRKHAVPEGTQGALGVDPDGLRLQIIMEDDAMMGMYAAYRQLRHPDNSLLVRPSAGNGLWSGVFKTGVPAYLELFGHGDPIRRLMGGYDGKTVAGYAATLRDRMNLEVLKVKAITCMGTLCDENGRSFVGDLTEGLREHGIDAPVSGYDKRITVTKEGRVEPWGSAPRISFPPAPMRPKIERRPARPPIEAPKNPDKYVRRVIGTVGRSADSYEAGLALYNKYGKRSVLMEKHQGSWMPTRSSDGSRIDGDVKVQLVGEGRNGKLGNRDAQDLARDVAAFHAIYGGKIAKVGLVSCNSNDCDATGKSLVDKVSTELHALGIDTNVVGRNGAVQVDRRGHKHAVPVGTPGSLGDGKAETSDGIEVKLDAPMPGSNKDKHDVIVIEEDDAFVGLMAGFRLQKHPLTSGLVLARGNKLTAVTGVFERGAEADVDLFGHGELRDGKRLLGGRDAKSLASQVMDLRDRLDLKIRKVHLFSCKSADCDETGRSMVDDMSEELLAQGITAPVKGHHGAIELTPDGRTIKAPTRAERSERTGGWDKFELPTPAAPTPVSTPPVVAEPVVEKYVRRVIGIGDGSTETYAAAMALYDKYPTHSVVLKRFRDSWLPTRTSNGNQTEGDVKVQLVGEGKDGKLGNRDAQDLARDVANFHARYGGKIAKVGLVSCNSNDCDATGKSLVDKVSTELHALGIDTNVVGRNGAVQVDRRGHKHAVPQGTPGSLGNVKVDLSSGALPESLAPSLTPHERALLGNLHAIDDSYFLGDDEEPLTRFLFRGDARYPAEIFLRGFAAWKRGPDVPVDLDEHQRGETKTNLVSLSKVPSVATGFANYMGLVTGRHVFVTWGQRGLDVNKRLPFSWQPDQYEVAVPDAVAPEMILGAYNVTSKGIVAGSFQPNPRFEARMDREGFAARQRSLLDRHASISSALDELKRKWPWKRKAVAKARLQLDRAKVEQELQGLYREQEAAARRDANRRDFLDTTLRE